MGSSHQIVAALQLPAVCRIAQFFQHAGLEPAVCRPFLQFRIGMDDPSYGGWGNQVAAAR